MTLQPLQGCKMKGKPFPNLCRELAICVSTFPIFAHLNFFLSILIFFFSYLFISLWIHLGIHFNAKCKDYFDVDHLNSIYLLCTIWGLAALANILFYELLWTILSICPLKYNKPDVNLISLLYYNCIVYGHLCCGLNFYGKTYCQHSNCFMEPPIPCLRAPSSFSHPLELDCSFLLSADFYLSGGQGAIEHFCCKDEPSSFPQKNKAIPSCCRRSFCLSRPWSNWSIWHHKSEYTIH